MATQSIPAVTHSRPVSDSQSASRFSALVGRLLFSGIFVMSGPSLFSKGPAAAAAQAGVPFASISVPLAGILAIAGGLSILLGYRARTGAWLIVAFLVPVTFFMHKFWGISDPMTAQMQMVNFLKNIALLGGALLIAYFGAGPVSFDVRRDSRN